MQVTDEMTLAHFEEMVWVCLESFSDHLRVQFVAFVTGSPVLDKKMEIKLSDAPATVGEGPFARQCAQFVTIPSYPDMTPELLATVLQAAMETSIEYDTI